MSEREPGPGRSARGTAALAAAASPPRAADAPITKRLHISGLNGNITRQALADRLASYGTVLEIDGCEPHHVDAVGTSAAATTSATDRR